VPAYARPGQEGRTLPFDLADSDWTVTVPLLPSREQAARGAGRWSTCSG
jgi:hypothetical protein